MGWNLGLASTSTIDMGAGNPGIASKTSYDAQGRVVATSQPKSNGSDAGTRQTVYYTAGANAAVAACGNKPEWADLLCQTHYAGAPSTGPDLITSTVTGYNDDQQPTEVTETSGSTTRTTTTTYRPDGMTASTAVNVTGLPGSTPVPSTSYTYAPDTGLLSTVTPSTGDPIITGYDDWGRTTTYSAAAGETTTTGYDAAGQVKMVTDPQGTTSYTYDGTDATGSIEHRGLPTSESVSNPNGRAVTITGAYNAAGDLTTETLPGAMTRRADYDTAGDLTGLSYSGHVTVDNGDGTSSDLADQEWVAWSRTYDAADRVQAEWTPDGAAYSGDTTGTAATGYARQYRYDGASRLTHVVDRTATPGAGPLDDPSASSTTGGVATRCAIRDYTFDANGNRTGLTSTPAAADGSCQTGTSPTGVTTKTWSYDNTDRITGGYVYDALGRQTNIPQADTPAGAVAGSSPGAVSVGYYDTDAVHDINQSGTTTTYSLDAMGRRTQAATGPAGGASTSSITSHYDDSSDNAAWETTTTATGSAVERNVEGISDDLSVDIIASGVVQIVMTNAHGDAVAQLSLPSSGNAYGVDDWASLDEYGNSQVNSSAGETATNPSGVTSTGAGGGLGYGWLGSAQRATDASGLVLMGVRLYNPSTALFLSPDPVYGGNSTAYSYPQDPINSSDISGLMTYPGGEGAGPTPPPTAVPQSKTSKERLRAEAERISRQKARGKNSLYIKSYSEDGKTAIRKRVDLRSAAHNGIETPHVQTQRFSRGGARNRWNSLGGGEARAAQWRDLMEAEQFGELDSRLRE
ncbi:MAG: RHS repeat-associated core domain-containing protein [Marmoricola sp.]